MIQLHLTQVTALERAVADLDARIEAALAPFRAAVSLLTTMPGVKTTAAAVILAEIGADMAVFPSAGHLSRGPGCVLVWTRAPANGAPHGRGRAHHG